MIEERASVREKVRGGKVGVTRQGSTAGLQAELDWLGCERRRAALIISSRCRKRQLWLLAKAGGRILMLLCLNSLRGRFL